MAEKVCKLSATFKATESIGARFVPTGFVASTDLFGNDVEKSILSVYDTTDVLSTSFSTSISKKGVFSTGISLNADFSCKTLDTSTSEETDCGKLDFSQTCSSVHIVTIGL